MEEKKSHEKGKVASSSSERGRRRTVKRRIEDDDASSQRNGNDKFERRIEDISMEKGKIASCKRSKNTLTWKRIEGRGKIRSREVIEIINDDVLEVIMLRLPVKSLIRFQIVSKHWRLKITSSSFKERYLLHQKTQEPKFICAYKDLCKRRIALMTVRLERSSTGLVEEEEDYTSDGDEHGLAHKKDVGIISKSLDGLVCFYASMDLARQIKVINPATRWSYKLPLARIQIECYFDNKDSVFPLPGFGKDNVKGTYKMVWLHDIYNTTLSCEVFDFGVKQWRHVNPPSSDNGLKRKLPTFANGWLYWLHQDKMKLIAFDLHMEKFRIIPNPIIEASSFVDMHMDSIDGHRHVCISGTNGDGMQHVWRLTNHNTGGALLKMDKMFSIDWHKITSTCFDPNYSSLFNIEAISKNGNKMLLTKKYHNLLLLFQPVNSTYRILYFSSPSPGDSTLVPFFPSFVSLM